MRTWIWMSENLCSRLISTFFMHVRTAESAQVILSQKNSHRKDFLRNPNLFTSIWNSTIFWSTETGKKKTTKQTLRLLSKVVTSGWSICSGVGLGGSGGSRSNEGSRDMHASHIVIKTLGVCWLSCTVKRKRTEVTEKRAQRNETWAEGCAQQRRRPRRGRRALKSQETLSQSQS